MTASSPKKILIVDDEESIRESLKLILSDNYDLILTDDGGQCLEFVENDESIGLVLLDIKIPGANGLDILKEIKAKRPHVNVVIVSGYKAVDVAAEAASLGADGYITKPFKSDEIIQTVREKLG